MPKPVYQIVAVARNRAIGLNRKLPWRIPEEWDYFIQTTKGGIMIMGRICAEEFGEGMPDRDMIAITHQRDFSLPGFQVAHSIDEALNIAQASQQPGPIWICGGVDIYEKTLEISERLYISFIEQEFEGDRYYPQTCMDAFTVCVRCESRKEASTPHRMCIYKKPS